MIDPERLTVKAQQALGQAQAHAQSLESVKDGTIEFDVKRRSA